MDGSGISRGIGSLLMGTGAWAFIRGLHSAFARAFIWGLHSAFAWASSRGLAISLRFSYNGFCCVL